MNTQVIIRLESGLKKTAGDIAKSEGKNISELVRELLVNYVKSRNLSGYIDGLWNRIGNRLKEKGTNVSDIDTIIRKVRLEK